MTTVIKRNGSSEKYDVEKIRKVIRWACDGTNVNPFKLESSLDTILFDGIKTSDIHQNLIFKAKSFICLEEPSWRYVAGKLLMQNIWKQAFIERGDICYGDCDNYIRFVKKMISDGFYDETILDTPEKENKLREVFNSVEFDIQRDFLYDFAGAQQLSKKYLMRYELPQEMYLTIAFIIGSQLQRMIPSFDNTIYNNIYEALSNLKISLATPILINLRKKNGNLSSCFTIAIQDSLESIMDNAKRAAMISKNAGGVGLCFSSIRARGSSIQNIYGCSNGVAPWIKIFNDVANACNQLNTRKGAFTVSLDVWHNDILEFLDINTETGDLRLKSFDVFPQVIVNDVFMEAVEHKKDWYTFCPHEVKNIYQIDLTKLHGEKFREAYEFLISKTHELKVYQCHKAINIFKKILQVQIETGLPYIFFKDTANKYNPNKNIGLIRNGNLCMESFSNTEPDSEIHVCNLDALNLSRITDINDISKYAELATWFLDALIEITKVPTELGEYHNKKYRTIGVGIIGLADHLAYNKYNFTTGKEYIGKLFEEFGYSVTKASMELCKKGLKPFESFSDSTWAEGKLIGKDLSWFEVNSSDYSRWSELSRDILKYGIRNSQCSALMPSTSTSLLQGCTAAFLPPYDIYIYDENTNIAPLMPKYIEERFNYYQANLRFNQRELVDIVATKIQPWIDTGISFELIFDLNNTEFNAPFLRDCILDAWKKDIKTIYYIRTEPIKEASCESCAS